MLVLYIYKYGIHYQQNILDNTLDTFICKCAHNCFRLVISRVFIFSYFVENGQYLIIRALLLNVSYGNPYPREIYFKT